MKKKFKVIAPLPNGWKLVDIIDVMDKRRQSNNKSKKPRLTLWDLMMKLNKIEARLDNLVTRNNLVE